MFFLRVAAGLVVLFCFLTSLAAGAEVAYSGVPGKWKKTTKEAKAAAAAAEATAQENQKKAKERAMSQLPKRK